MSTILRFGPLDHGRRIQEEELAGARYQEGYRYEIIEGRLYVSPAPNPSHDDIVEWIFELLLDYSRQQPDVANRVTRGARVVVPDHPDLTVPEPDVAVYHNWPLGQSRRHLRWEDHTPILVVEVVSEDSAEKDLVRNVRLYRLVPGIREYWIIDPRADPDRPSLLVYRRRGTRWQSPLSVLAGSEYTTRLVPGFRLRLDS
jgi:Uma2 family endonuclease